MALRERHVLNPFRPGARSPTLPFALSHVVVTDPVPATRTLYLCSTPARNIFVVFLVTPDHTFLCLVMNLFIFSQVCVSIQLEQKKWQTAKEFGCYVNLFHHYFNLNWSIQYENKSSTGFGWTQYFPYRQFSKALLPIPTARSIITSEEEKQDSLFGVSLIHAVLLP